MKRKDNHGTKKIAKKLSAGECLELCHEENA